MDAKRISEEELDGVIADLLAHPAPNRPPEQIRRRVLAIGKEVERRRAPSFNVWLKTIAAASALLAAADFAWWDFTNVERPVCWVLDADAGECQVVFNNARIAKCEPPESFR